MPGSESGEQRAASEKQKVLFDASNDFNAINTEDVRSATSQGVTNFDQLIPLNTDGNKFQFEAEPCIDVARGTDVEPLPNIVPNLAQNLRSSTNEENRAESFMVGGINNIGTLGDGNEKNMTLRFSIPIPQAGPRPTSSIHGSAYSSTPGTFSISSRGCTSTAPSTVPSTCSSNNSVVSLNEKGVAGNGKGQNMNRPNGSQPKQASSAQSQNDSATITATSNLNETIVLGNDTGQSPTIDRIDSALLSALCDPRERYGLLRLEQTLIEFMNERTTGYIEVGGPNNSIVIGGKNGGKFSSIAASCQTGVGLCENEIRIGKQTSFQRLCLHRLADRFNIARESASSLSSWSAGLSPTSTNTSADDTRACNSGLVTVPASGSSMPGLIRLVKVKNSRIPQNLLIDLDVSSYQRHDSRIGSSLHKEVHSGDRKPESVCNLSENFASISVDDKNSKPFHKKSNFKPRRKMKIMKRNNGSNNSLKSTNSNEQKNSKKKNRNNLKGKNLSDKEKAYAEARARIFNETQPNANGDIFEKIKQSREIESVSQIQTPTNMSTAVRQNTSASPESSVAPSEIEDDTEALSKVSFVSVNGLNETTEADIENSSTSTSLSFARDSQHAQAAASATSGAASKVTWRNRRHEENDPDFWRGFSRHSQYYGPSTSGQNFMNNSPNNVQANSYSHHGMMPQHHHSPQIYYPSGSHSRIPYNISTESNGGQYSQNLSQGHSQQTPTYYSNHSQSPAYYHHSQHNQLHPNYHINNGSYVAASNSAHVSMYGNREVNSSTSNNVSSKRTGNIVYNMEEFPVLQGSQDK